MSVLALFLSRSPLGALRARLGVTKTWSRRRHVFPPLSVLSCQLETRAPERQCLWTRRTLLTGPPPLPRTFTRIRLAASSSRDGHAHRPKPKGHEGDSAQSSLTHLYENPWTIPNMLSMTRIGLSPVLGYLVVGEDFNLALGLFAFAGMTDLLDGYIARNWANQKSALGSALDPLADKILISVLYVCLTYAHLIPVPLTIMIILRDVALIASVFYVRYKTLPPPKTLSRYFNPCYATAQLEPTFISKMNTAVQLILVAASLAAPVFNYVDSIYLQTLWFITAFTTAASAYSYYHYGQETVKVLRDDK
ncbi:hypothetical protein XELAEV_18028811mg [Xenopus laevis]|uniref:Cardiolipin synthase (CMP-forming) n=1 Tax=Xenopus laevis TaxID=8355 RepID=A0A974HGZ8_XENLA|nr:hypothetical protein XELAEV_18028811mg [Xenopus laevis]